MERNHSDKLGDPPADHVRDKVQCWTRYSVGETEKEFVLHCFHYIFCIYMYTYIHVCMCT